MNMIRQERYSAEDIQLIDYYKKYSSLYICGFLLSECVCCLYNLICLKAFISFQYKLLIIIYLQIKVIKARIKLINHAQSSSNCSELQLCMLIREFEPFLLIFAIVFILGLLALCVLDLNDPNLFSFKFQ